MGSMGQSGIIHRGWRAVAGALALLFSLAFMVAIFWGGFRVHFPWGVLSVTQPLRPLLAALACAGLHAWLARPSSDKAEAVNHLSDGPAGVAPSRASAAAWILFASLMLTVRLGYRAYLPAMRGGDARTDALPWILLVYTISGVGAYRAFVFFTRSGYEEIALIAAGFWALTPMVFPVSPPVTLGYLAAAAVLPGSPLDFRARPGRVLYWTVGGAVCLGLAIGLAWLGPGWALGRVRSALSALTFGGTWLVPILAGSWVLVSRPHPLRSAFGRAAALWLPGLALAGTRGGWGAAGAALGVPLLALLLAAGLGRFGELFRARRVRLAGNVLLLCAAAVAMAWVRHGLAREFMPSAARPPPAAGEDAGTDPASDTDTAGSLPEDDIDREDDG